MAYPSSTISTRSSPKFKKQELEKAIISPLRNIIFEYATPPTVGILERALEYLTMVDADKQEEDDTYVHVFGRNKNTYAFLSNIWIRYSRYSKEDCKNCGGTKHCFDVVVDDAAFSTICSTQEIVSLVHKKIINILEIDLSIEGIDYPLFRENGGYNVLHERHSALSVATNNFF